MFIWYKLWTFGTFYGHLVYFTGCTKKNLATLLENKRGFFNSLQINNLKQNNWKTKDAKREAEI
jgi:hypothetical protein